jgi:urease accessory protein
MTTTITTTITTTMAEPGPDPAALYRLLAWLSPAFPTGGFSYSHGLEAAAERGELRDRATLERWIAAIVAAGAGRIDADLLRGAHRATTAGDAAGVADAVRRGNAYRATAELALEAGAQGAAFRAACAAAWGGGAAALDDHDGPICHAVAFGAAAAGAGVPLAVALRGYLQAFAANLVSAGLRLGLIGQTDGQRIVAALEPVVEAAARDAMTRDADDFGGAAFAVDLASMAHETQYSRLFRS